MKRIDINHNYEEIVNISKIGNIRIFFWFYGCPRIEVRKILKNRKKINFAHDHAKLLDFLNTLITEEVWNGFCVDDNAIDKVAEYLPTILIKRTEDERKAELKTKIAKHKEIIHKLEYKLTKYDK